MSFNGQKNNADVSVVLFNSYTQNPQTSNVPLLLTDTGVEAHMEVATIDWNDSKFEKDELYEDINAPQWIDFSANHPHPSTHDDDAWFCRPGNFNLLFSSLQFNYFFFSF